jgi:predicted Zn-dependent protease
MQIVRLNVGGTRLVLVFWPSGRKGVMDKIAMLTDILAQNPNDAFARYGLAMELANQNQTDAAITEFDRLLSAHPDYTAGYFMEAQTLVKAGRGEEAKVRLSEGIASARRTGNQHALNEMEALLAELE